MISTEVLWFIHSIMSLVYYKRIICLLGHVIQPRVSSIRFLVGTWLFISVALYATYTANLTAFLAVKRTTMPFDTLSEMASQTEYQYGADPYAAAMLIFKVINPYTKM